MWFSLSPISVSPLGFTVSQIARVAGNSLLRLSTIPGVAIDRINPVKSGADLAKGGIHWGR